MLKDTEIENSPIAYFELKGDFSKEPDELDFREINLTKTGFKDASKEIRYEWDSPTKPSINK